MSNRKFGLPSKGRLVREDSVEADLYEMLIRDLNMAGIIRQGRDITENERFLKNNVRRTEDHRPRLWSLLSKTLSPMF